MTDWLTNFDRPDEKAKLYQMLKTLSGPHRIRIERQYNRRSINQNRYYWGQVIRYYCEETGYTPYEGHVVLGNKFLPTVWPINEDGFWSTAKLSTVEFEDYLQAIRDYCLDKLSLTIPEPNQAIF